MRRRVVITGMGALTPLGIGVQASWEGALAGRSGIRIIDLYDPSPLKTQIAGIVPPFELSSFVEPRVPLPDDHRRSRFAFAATEMAVRDAGLDLERLDPGRVGIAMASNETYFQQEVIGPHFNAARAGDGHDDGALVRSALERESPLEMLFQESQQTVSALSMHYNVQGPTASYLTACAAGTQAIGEGLRMIRRGAADVCIAGGFDSMLAPIKVVGFSSIGALSKRNAEPERASRPFDAGRDGFVLGEGAGVLILESLERALERGAHIYCEVLGYGVAIENHHVTAMSPDATGPTAAITRALADAGVGPERIGYINAHGTSTIENDRAETLAIKNVFGEYARSVPVSSTKSMTGHLVAAAGAVEAIFSVLALRDQIAPPTINYETPDPQCDLDCVPNEARPIEAECVMSNSFGFGGQNATLVLGRLRDAR